MLPNSEKWGVTPNHQYGEAGGAYEDEVLLTQRKFYMVIRVILFCDAMPITFLKRNQDGTLAKKIASTVIPNYRGTGSHAALHVEAKNAIRNSVQELRWSREVRMRAGNRCEVCGCVHHELQAHHIIPLKQLVVQHDIVSLEQAIACDIFNPQNGRAVCPSCHAKEHEEHE